MRIGISPKLAEHFPHLKVAKEGSTFSITIAHVSERERFMFKYGWKTLRPFYVNNLEDAKKTLELLESIERKT